MASLAKGAIGVLLAIGLAWWAFAKIKGESEERERNAVRRERVRVADSLKTDFAITVKRLSDSVTVRVDTVRKFSTRWDTVRAGVDTVYAVDSSGNSIPAVPLPIYEAVVAAGDSLNRACTLLANSCERLRDSIPKLQQLYQNASDARDSLLAHPKPFRRWSLCGSAGYGLSLGGGSVSTGPSIGVGICYRIL